MVQTRLEGKVVLITGANHGIGAATARAFAAEGAKVLLNYLRMPPLGDANSSNTEDENTPGAALYHLRRSSSADTVVQAIREMSRQGEAIEADLSDTTTIPMLFDQAEALFGSVDVLVNNADHCEQDTFLPQNLTGDRNLAPDGFPTHTITAAYHDQHFAVNSRAVVNLRCQVALSHFT